MTHQRAILEAYMHAKVRERRLARKEEAMSTRLEGWRPAYHWLRSQPAGARITWAEYKDFTGQDPKRTRAWLTRIGQELRDRDGLTIGGQSKEGFRVIAIS